MAQQTANYFPLAIGNKWTYLFSSGSQSATLNAAIDAKETVGNVECYVRAIILQQGNQRECYSWTDNQLFLYKTVADFQTYVMNPPLLYLDSSLEAGHTWTWQGQAQGENSNDVPSTETFQVIGPATVTVPAGTFDTIEIQVTHSDSYYAVGTRWFAAGVGLVKDVSTTQGVTGTTELQTFQISSESSMLLQESTLNGQQPQTQNSAAQPPYVIIAIGISIAAVGAIAIDMHLNRRKNIPPAGERHETLETLEDESHQCPHGVPVNKTCPKCDR